MGEKIFNFIDAAYKAAISPMQEIDFVCPICGGNAIVFKDESGRHLASCWKCSTRFMEGRIEEKEK